MQIYQVHSNKVKPLIYANDIVRPLIFKLQKYIYKMRL